jgi:hypothetical protein
MGLVGLRAWIKSHADAGGGLALIAHMTTIA